MAKSKKTNEEYNYDSEIFIEQETDDGTMFTADGNEYCLRLPFSRYAMYERKYGSAFDIFMNYSQDGTATVKTPESYRLVELLSYAVFDIGESKFLNPKGKGYDIAFNLLKANGLSGLTTVAMDVLQRDCGFLLK